MIQTVLDKNRYESPISEELVLHMEAILQTPSDTPPVDGNKPGDDSEIPF